MRGSFATSIRGIILELNIIECDACSTQAEIASADGWERFSASFESRHGAPLPAAVNPVTFQHDLCPGCAGRLRRAIASTIKPDSKLESIEQAEKRHILFTLAITEWNKSEAARALGIQRSTLDRKLQRWGVSRPVGAGASA